MSKENKLGVTDDSQLWEIEYYLFNIKYHLIDETFTFNEETMFSVDFLEKIHIFLFGDIYSLEDCKIKSTIPKESIDKMNKLLSEIKEMIYNCEPEKLKNKIYGLWRQQIFYDGNTRTILCFLKIISKAFDFSINYDFTKDVSKDYFINDVLDEICKVKNKGKIKKIV